MSEASEAVHDVVYLAEDSSAEGATGNARRMGFQPRRQPTGDHPYLISERENGTPIIHLAALHPVEREQRREDKKELSIEKYKAKIELDGIVSELRRMISQLPPDQQPLAGIDVESIISEVEGAIHSTFSIADIKQRIDAIRQALDTAKEKGLNAFHAAYADAILEKAEYYGEAAKQWSNEFKRQVVAFERDVERGGFSGALIKHDYRPDNMGVAHAYMLKYNPEYRQQVEALTKREKARDEAAAKGKAIIDPLLKDNPQAQAMDQEIEALRKKHAEERARGNEAEAKKAEMQIRALEAQRAELAAAKAKEQRDQNPGDPRAAEQHAAVEQEAKAARARDAEARRDWHIFKDKHLEALKRELDKDPNHEQAAARYKAAQEQFEAMGKQVNTYGADRILKYIETLKKDTAELNENVVNTNAKLVAAPYGSTIQIVPADSLDLTTSLIKSGASNGNMMTATNSNSMGSPSNPSQSSEFTARGAGVKIASEATPSGGTIQIVSADSLDLTAALIKSGASSSYTTTANALAPDNPLSHPNQSIEPNALPEDVKKAADAAKPAETKVVADAKEATHPEGHQLVPNAKEKPASAKGATKPASVVA